MKGKLDDEYLYKEIPKIVEKDLMKLPKEEELNHVFSDSFEERKKEIIGFQSEEKKKRFLFSSPRAVTIAAVLTLCFLVTLGSVLAGEMSRKSIFHFIRQTFSDFMTISVHEEPLPGASSESGWIWKAKEPRSLAPGFKETSRKQTEDFLEIFYQNAAGNEITFFTLPLVDEQIIIDTEDTTLHQEKIGGVTVSYFEKNGMSFFFWHDFECRYEILGDVKADILMEIVKKMLRQ